MVHDEQWPVARLIPISSATGVEAQERRLASALLAVMQAVPEFARALLKPLGSPVGRVESFIEVPLKFGDRTVRPDGIISVSRGTKSWTALVEAKTASNPLESVQMNTYLDLARELEFEAVLSISKQYVSSSTDYPIEIDRRKLRRVALHHWSWTDILTEAIVQAEHRGVSDPDQAYILNELIRYLSDPRSGAVDFDGMGSSWTAVRDGVREGTLRKAEPAVGSIAARWDDLVRYLALSLTSELGRQVRHALPKAETSPAARRQALMESLAAKGQLYADLAIRDVAGTLSLVADLRARQLTASTVICPEGRHNQRAGVVASQADAEGSRRGCGRGSLGSMEWLGCGTAQSRPRRSGHPVSRERKGAARISASPVGQHGPKALQWARVILRLRGEPDRTILRRGPAEPACMESGASKATTSAREGGGC